jgi:hypothetical protein
MLKGGTSRMLGGRDAPPSNLPPVGRAGCPSGDLPPVGRAGCRVRGLFANKKFFLFAKRPSGGVWEIFLDLPPVGWAGGLRPHASRPLIGREASIFRIFPNRHPFSEFNFFKPHFFKKTLLLSRGTTESGHVGPTNKHAEKQGWYFLFSFF